MARNMLNSSPPPGASMAKTTVLQTMRNKTIAGMGMEI